MVLQEGQRRREVLIGRSTYLDTQSGVRIVDWRDAPVSRLYYRYEEGDEYDEVFGDREVNGEVVTRRSLNIVDAELRRIGAPQGSFARGEGGSWRRLVRRRHEAHRRPGHGAAGRPAPRPGHPGRRAPRAAKTATCKKSPRSSIHGSSS